MSSREENHSGRDSQNTDSTRPVIPTHFSFSTTVLAPALFYSGFAVWFGGFMFFGLGVAAVLFKVLPVEAAGQLNSTILERLNIFECCGASLMFFGLALYRRVASGLRNLLPSLLLWISVILLFIYALYIGPEMRSLNAQMLGLDAADLALISLKAEFDVLHGWYTSLAGVTLGLIFVVFVLQTFNFSMPPHLRSAGLAELMRVYFPSITTKD